MKLLIPRLMLAQFAAALVSLASGTLEAQDAWDQADRQTRRLAPSTFRELPPLIRADLERRGCTVPQVSGATAPGNAIRGHFRSSGKIDWAVLCSVERVSTLLVYSEGGADSVAELASGRDKDYLQGVGSGQIGFSHAISVADSVYIREHFEEYGGPKPPRLDHEGIEDAFVEKASTVWYWYLGNWLQLSGAD